MGILKFFQTRLQWRLMLYILPLVIIPVVVSTIFTSGLWGNSLTDEVVEAERTTVDAEVAALTTFLSTTLADVNFLAGEAAVNRLAQALLAGDEEAVEAERALAQQIFLTVSSNRGIYNQVRFLDTEGNEVVRVDFDGSTFAVVPVSDLQFKGDRSYFTETAALEQEGVYISPLNLNREGSLSAIEGTLTDGTIVPTLRYGVPVYVNDPVTDQVRFGGVVVTNVLAQNLFDLLRLELEDGNIFLANSEGYYLFNANQPERVFGFEEGIEDIGGVAGATVFDDFPEEDVTAMFSEDVAAVNSSSDVHTRTASFESSGSAHDFVFLQHLRPPGAPEGYEWAFVRTRDRGAFLAAADDVQRAGLIVVAVIAVLGSIVVVLIARQLTSPISLLGDVAGRLAGGDLEVRAADTIQRQDEIGQLGNAFDNMAERVQELIDSLEDRVAARTLDLTRAVEVGSVVTRIYSQEDMLPHVTDFIRDNFGLYYAQIYLLDEAQRYANLRAATGEVGQQLLERQHRLDMAETSLVAQAVQSGAPVLVEDTETSTIHKKNPLLPDTRSELSVPLIVGEEILGVLDMQSRRPGTFIEENVPVFEAIASQLAASLKGAQAYDEAQKSIQRAEMIAQRLTGEKWHSYLGRLGAGERVGYEYDLEAPKPLQGAVALDGESNGDEPEQNYVAVPIEVQGRQIGVLKAEDDTVRVWTDEERTLVRGISEQVARAVEQFRAFDETEKRAAELHTVAQVSAAASRMQTLEDLLPRVADLTKESFDLYHAHIYLLDAESETLELAAGAGDVGRSMVDRGHSIDLHNPTSIVARAARTREGVVENDVRSASGFLPNPLLPHTRAEMATPMVVGDQLVGVLDVQANVINRFTEEDVLIKTTLADQIAVAVQNARTFETEREAAERLREVDRLKSQFLANMSHELRTPLNSIIGYAEVLLDGIDGDLTDEATMDVQDIHNSGKHLLAIINDILDLAKIEAGQMKMDAEIVPIQDIVDDVAHTAQILVKEKPVDLQVIADPDPIYVEADPIRLRQVVLNLVSNAVKFTEEGNVTLEIGRNSDDEATVKVIDTGIGMSEEGLAVIFERFSQVDGSATRRSDGTGLGLTITRELVQLHGGEIFADSQEGAGSTFWFTIPIAEHEMVGK